MPPPGFEERIDALMEELDSSLTEDVNAFYQADVERVKMERGYITLSRDEILRRDRNYLRLYLTDVLLMHEQEPDCIVTAAKDLDYTTTFTDDWGERKVRPAFVIGTNKLRDLLGNQFSLEVISTLPQLYQEHEIPKLFLEAGIKKEVVDDMVANGLMFSTKDGRFSANPESQTKLGVNSDRRRNRSRYEDKDPVGYPAKFEVSTEGEIEQVHDTVRKVRSILPIVDKELLPGLVKLDPSLFYDLKLWVLRQQLEEEDEAWSNVDLDSILGVDPTEFGYPEADELPVRRAIVYFDDFAAAQIVDPLHSRLRACHVDWDAMFFLIDYPKNALRVQNSVYIREELRKIQ